MTNLQPDTVAIHRLRIQTAGNADGKGLQRTGARVRQEIEWADWPEAPGESWVFIRQVHARAPSEQLARKLVQTTREKVNGGQGQDVVRFANLTKLIAALLTDLTQGQAYRRWYWQRWSRLFQQETGTAIASVAAEHLDRLPAVCARLAEQRQLERVWLRLGEEGARNIMAQFAWRYGIKLPSAARWASALAETGHSTSRSVLHVGHAVRDRWSPLLARLPPSDLRSQLALLLLGQEVAPLMLQREPLQLLVALSEYWQTRLRPTAQPVHEAGVTAYSVTRLGETSLVGSQESVMETEAGISPAHSASPTTKVATNADPHQPQKGQAVEVSAKSTPAIVGDGDPLLTTPEQADALRTSGPAASAFQEKATAAPRTTLPQVTLDTTEQTAITAAVMSEEQFYTQQGGLFYLLNFLNRKEMQSILGDYWMQLPSGWAWLYRIGQELQLDETDPVAAYIATRLGFQNPGQLAELPVLPARDQILQLAVCWYGNTDLWKPELLRLTARVQATPSHVDVYAALNAVQMPIRLAGLDINPGWLPWLGRVVTFHYD